MRSTLEVDIAGEIGWDVDDVQINSALREGDDYEKVLVRVNSPGGNAWTGVAIYNRLVEVDVPVETRIMGEAASAASIIAMAGDEITINEASSIRVHYPYVGVVGNAGKAANDCAGAGRSQRYDGGYLHLQNRDVEQGR